MFGRPRADIQTGRSGCYWPPIIPGVQQRPHRHNQQACATTLARSEPTPSQPATGAFSQRQAACAAGHIPSSFLASRNSTAAQRCPRHRKAHRVHRCTVQDSQACAEEDTAAAPDNECVGTVESTETARSHSASRPEHSKTSARPSLPLISDKHVEASADETSSQPPESGILPEERIHHIAVPASLKNRHKSSAHATTSEAYSQHGGVFYPPAGKSRLLNIFLCCTL